MTTTTLSPLRIRRNSRHLHTLKILPPKTSRPSIPKLDGKWPFTTVSIRPLCDSRSGTLHAGKRPVIRDGERFALRLAEVGLSRLGEGHRTPAYRRSQNLPRFLPVSSRN